MGLGKEEGERERDMLSDPHAHFAFEAYAVCELSSRQLPPKSIIASMTCMRDCNVYPFPTGVQHTCSLIG